MFDYLVVMQPEPEIFEKHKHVFKNNISYAKIDKITRLPIALSAMKRLQAVEGHVTAKIPNPTRMVANTLIMQKILVLTNDTPKSNTKERESIRFLQTLFSVTSK